MQQCWISYAIQISCCVCTEGLPAAWSLPRPRKTQERASGNTLGQALSITAVNTWLALDHLPSRLILTLKAEEESSFHGHTAPPLHLPEHFHVQGKITPSSGPQHTPEAFSRKRLSGSRPQMSACLTYKVHMDEFPSSQMAAPQVSNLTEVKVWLSAWDRLQRLGLKEPAELSSENVRQCVSEKTKITVQKSVKSNKPSFILLLMDMNYAVQEAQLVWRI